MTGIPISGSRLSTPYDPSDFRRCQALLIAVPDFAARLGEMASAGPTWAALVARWTEIEALMLTSTAAAYELIRTNTVQRARSAT